VIIFSVLFSVSVLDLQLEAEDLATEQPYSYFGVAGCDLTPTFFFEPHNNTKFRL
jgi:hypothetical protein